MGLSNDERGWVMTGLSGVACVIGAAVICIDIIIRQFPGKRNFRIEDSDAFLSSSLSLSFGVMLFSALYSMLPSAKDSLKKDGFSAKKASWIMIASFVGGIIGIQIISNIIHRFIPSHVVDCEHTHDDHAVKEDLASADDSLESDPHEHDHDSHEHTNHTKHDEVQHERNSTGPNRKPPSFGRLQSTTHTHRPMLSSRHSLPQKRNRLTTNPQGHTLQQEPASEQSYAKGRPSIGKRLTSTISQITGKPAPACGEDCYGFTLPCAAECFQNINARGGYRSGMVVRPVSSREVLTRPMTEDTPLLHNMVEVNNFADGDFHRASSHVGQQGTHEEHEGERSIEHDDHDEHNHRHRESSDLENLGEPEHHHHHVPKNAFLSIGLQTSIAIALHKLPEGFITYATNHANPKLGVAVFLALFIHNITEGFALALPLYLALHSRTKAMVIAFALGGLTQPLGAGIAALWFKIAGKGQWAPSEGVYGAMFAVTAGIMASVGLQLFSEALDLTHSRMLCMVGAFSGMAILGISSALTA